MQKCQIYRKCNIQLKYLHISYPPIHFLTFFKTFIHIHTHLSCPKICYSFQCIILYTCTHSHTVQPIAFFKFFITSEDALTSTIFISEPVTICQSLHHSLVVVRSHQRWAMVSKSRVELWNSVNVFWQFLMGCSVNMVLS